MSNVFHIASDASFVMGKPIFGIGVVVLDEVFTIQKMLSIPLRSMERLRTDNPSTHEYHAVVTALGAVPAGSTIHLYVDNKCVQKAVNNTSDHKHNSRFYGDFEYVYGLIKDQRARHQRIQAHYLHDFPHNSPVTLAGGIAHNASSVATGGRKRQKTTPLLSKGPFACHFNGQVKKTKRTTTPSYPLQSLTPAR